MTTPCLLCCQEHGDPMDGLCPTCRALIEDPDPADVEGQELALTDLSAVVEGRMCPKCWGRRCVVGHEFEDVYDGVLVWSCVTCGFGWPRFTGVDRVGRVARREAARHNTRQAARS